MRQAEVGKIHNFYIFTLKEKTMKKLIAVLSVLIFTAGLSACNTFRGFGQDVERGGEKVQDAATGAQKK